MDSCKICTNEFHASPDELVLCEYKTGMVHMGCCVALCSQDGKPCGHCKAIYAKKP